MEGNLEGMKNENNKNFVGLIDAQDDSKTENLRDEYSKISVGKDGKNKENDAIDYLPEFAASKSDPKYQTLPYNTKFGMNYKNVAYQNGRESNVQQSDGFGKSTGVVNPVSVQQPQPTQQPLMTVHSTPILAPSLSSASKIPNHLNPRSVPISGCRNCIRTVNFTILFPGCTVNKRCPPGDNPLVELHHHLQLVPWQHHRVPVQVPIRLG